MVPEATARLVSGERPLQAPPGFCQPSFRRAGRNSQEPSDLVVRVSKDVVHHKDSTLGRRQLSESRLDGQCVFKRRLGHDGMAAVLEVGVLPPVAGTAMIEGGVDHDTMEPRKRRRVPSKPIPVTQRVEKGVLHDVFRVIAHVARRNGAQLPAGLFVLLQHRFSQRD